MGGAPYPFAIDRTGTLISEYGISTLGTVVIYNRAGKIVSRTMCVIRRSTANATDHGCCVWDEPPLSQHVGAPAGQLSGPRLVSARRSPPPPPRE
jgi:hypothetical protein